MPSFDREARLVDRSAPRVDLRGMAAPKSRLIRPFPLLVIVMLSALIVGGGGSPDARGEFIVQIVAIAALLALFFAEGRRGFGIDRPLLLIGACFVLVPLLQLVPLAPGIWTHLPSRGVVATAFLAVDPVLPWQPISVAPYDTLASLLSLIPPVAAGILCARCTEDDKAKVVRLIAVMAIAGAIVVSLQLAGFTGFTLHHRSDYAFPAGTFANRNAQADMLIVGMLAGLFVTSHAGPGTVRLAGMAVVAYLFFALLTTGSRTGLLLTIVPLAYGALLARHQWIVMPLPRRIGVVVAAGAALLALAATLVTNSVASTTLARFGAMDEGRTSVIWPDAWYAAQQFWPLGSGVGTFPIAFDIGEQLDTLGVKAANRAHNDYLEYLIEAGAFGIVVMVVALVGLVTLVKRAWRRASSVEEHNVVVFSAAALCVLALHSLVDYPVRAMTLAVVAATATALLAIGGRRHG